MSTTTYPQWLTLAEYARACSEKTGKHVSRQTISARVGSGALTVETRTVGHVSRDYIDTTKYPPGPGPGRWPNRPPEAPPLPRRPKKPTR